MASDPSIEKMLTDLADSFEQRPSIANRVADALNENSQAAVDLAERTRRQRDSSGLRVRVGQRWLLGAVGTMAGIVAVALIIVNSTTSVGFAEVQSALAKVTSVIISREFPVQTELNQRLFASVDHDTYRIEVADGRVVVQAHNGKTLTLNPKTRTGQISPGAGFGREGEMAGPVDYLKSLQSIETDAVKSLGKKAFDSRELIGFELPPMHGAGRQIWVDPKTRLPVREDVAKIGDVKGASETDLLAYRMPRQVVTYEFNVPLSDELFSMTPPPGYQVVDVLDVLESRPTRPEDLPEMPDHIDAKTLVLVPGKGLWKIRFGMMPKEVEDILGKPDNEMPFGELSAEEEKALEALQRRAKEENLDVYELNRESQRILNLKPQRAIKRVGIRLHYYGLGLDLGFREDTGLNEIQCYANTPMFRDFPGSLANGISMKSRIEDVKRQFGEPSKTFESGAYIGMMYREQLLNFTFKGHDVTQLTIYAPSADD